MISNIFNYAKRAGVTILKSYRDYQPLKTFLFLGLLLIIVGCIVGLKPLLHYLSTYTVAFYGSAMVAMLLLIIGFTTIVLGFLADIMRTQKKVQDEVLYRLKKLELNTINRSDR